MYYVALKVQFTKNQVGLRRFPRPSIVTSQKKFFNVSKIDRFLDENVGLPTLSGVASEVFFSEWRPKIDRFLDENVGLPTFLKSDSFFLSDVAIISYWQGLLRVTSGFI